MLKLYVPDYYPAFHCIADKCTHTCCAGWEIDIDPETCVKYRAMPGKMGEKLRKNIDFDDECPHFIMTPQNRCPFLNERGLCEIVINCGENALGQICTDHPRFTNWYGTRAEMGIGLCCEAACRLVLSKKDKFSVVYERDLDEDVLDTEIEEAFFDYRDKLFETLQDRSLALSERIRIACPKADLIKAENWMDFYLGLEMLHDSWADVLQTLKNPPARSDSSALETALEQTLVYLVFRNLKPEDPERTLLFCVLSLKLIEALLMRSKDGDFLALTDIVRWYSEEIEYSDDNIQLILNELE